jgi:hypothetical protein
LEAIQCTKASGDGGGNELEIYGTLEARGMVDDREGNPQIGFQKVLFSNNPRNVVVLGEGAEFPVNQTVDFPVFERDYLWIGGRIMDRDDTVFNPDDLLGDGFRIINYDDINNDTISVGFNSDDQEVLARYRIEMLGIDPHPEL